jgi:hypothetical protein
MPSGVELWASSVKSAAIAPAEIRFDNGNARYALSLFSIYKRYTLRDVYRIDAFWDALAAHN